MKSDLLHRHPKCAPRPRPNRAHRVRVDYPHLKDNPSALRRIVGELRPKGAFLFPARAEDLLKKLRPQGKLSPVNF